MESFLVTLWLRLKATCTKISKKGKEIRKALKMFGWCGMFHPQTQRCVEKGGWCYLTHLPVKKRHGPKSNRGLHNRRFHKGCQKNTQSCLSCGKLHLHCCKPVLSHSIWLNCSVDGEILETQVSSIFMHLLAVLCHFQSHSLIPEFSLVVKRENHFPSRCYYVAELRTL